MKIIYIDDEEEILNMLGRHLKLEGFDVVTTTDPLHGVELMKEHLFNLAITDIRMPGMSGIELVKTFKEINPFMSIIVTTGFSNMRYMVECLDNGATDYFTKPFNRMEELIGVVKDGQRRMERWERGIKLGQAQGNLRIA